VTVKSRCKDISCRIQVNNPICFRKDYCK